MSIKISLLNKIKLPLIFIGIFWTIAIVMWLSTGKIFYLYNFVYIGTSIAIGMGFYELLPKKKKPIGRKITLFLVGLYMFGFLGLLNSENMQLEGFFFYLFSGVFMAATLHYTIAKIIGPFVFGRGWCGWACWTAMILDLLPYTKSPGRISRKWEILRYLHFIISFAIVLTLWFAFQFRVQRNGTELYWLIAGNALYYAAGIALAFVLKDNRAFCKYLCPITVFLKVGSRFSMLRIDGDSEKCNECGACEKACPMDIRIPEYIKKKQRVLSTECIFCNTCVNVCPNSALNSSFKIDAVHKELLRLR